MQHVAPCMVYLPTKLADVGVNAEKHPMEHIWGLGKLKPENSENHCFFHATMGLNPMDSGFRWSMLIH